MIATEVEHRVVRQIRQQRGLQAANFRDATALKPLKHRSQNSSDALARDAHDLCGRHAVWHRH